MSETYNLIFFPTVQAGDDEAEVKSKLTSALKIDASKVDAWFSAGKPTLLLKGASYDVADRYMQAITQCGGNCNLQPSSENPNLSLVPKPANIFEFQCPSCGYEEELAAGTEFEDCPECGLVLDKWEEKQLREAEKEEIRRRLLRDARFQDEGESEQQKKEQELERIRALEREIMLELGIKPPSRFWTFYSGHPISLSTVFASLLISLSLSINFFVSQYFNDIEQQAVKAKPASQEVQQLAPLLANAVGLEQNGNGQMLSELATATQLIQGIGAGSKQEMISQTENMMKGAGSSEFVSAALNYQALSARSKEVPGGAAPVTINAGTLGGIRGLPGVNLFSDESLGKIAGPSEESGQDQLLNMISKKVPFPDPDNPNGADILVERIDRLDGSMMVGLMKALSTDYEWDLFLVSYVNGYLDDRLVSYASELSNQIKNPLLKIRAMGDILAYRVSQDPERNLRADKMKIRNVAKKLVDTDTEVRLMLSLGEMLAVYGAIDEPMNSLMSVEDLLDKTNSPADQAIISSRIALANLQQGNHALAKQNFTNAMKFAGRERDIANRINVFTLIAQRYYDARNTTLASEILTESQLIAATRLKGAERSRVFGQIAAAQLYTGDFDGAIISIANAGADKARDQLAGRLAETLITQSKPYQARRLIESISDQVEKTRLIARLITYTYYEDDADRAIALLGIYNDQVRLIDNDKQRIVLQSLFARLYARFGDVATAEQQFKDALTLSESLSGRSKAIARGLVALNQARALWIKEARETVEYMTEIVVKEPIDTEITEIKRVIENHLPESVLAKSSL
jgi:hypothetical protein